MLQDLKNLTYDNTFLFEHPDDKSVCLLYAEQGIFAKSLNGFLTLPLYSDLSPEYAALPFHYGFSISDARYFYTALPNVEHTVTELIPSRQYRNMLPKHYAFACCVGESLNRWRIGNRYCGRCGKPMQDSSTERALVCPDCGNTVYPKISPAVIAAVCDGDRLLLTKYRGRAFKRYALVAGFNEIGESIEDTVRREVLEETGLRINDLHFYKSQPWVLTDSLLMGFFCRLDGPDHIRLQTDELSEGQWFDRSELPTDHSEISLTGEMIEFFRLNGFPES